MKIKKINSAKELEIIKNLCLDFSNLYSKSMNWEFWQKHMGALINAKISECLIAKSNEKIKGFLLYTFFPDLLTGELTATEMYWYAEKNNSLIGVKLFNQFLINSKNKNAKKINVTHLTQTPEVGEFLKNKGFEKIEINYSLKVM